MLWNLTVFFNIRSGGGATLFPLLSPCLNHCKQDSSISIYSKKKKFCLNIDQHYRTTNLKSQKPSLQKCFQSVPFVFVLSMSYLIYQHKGGGFYGLYCSQPPGGNLDLLISLLGISNIFKLQSMDRPSVVGSPIHIYIYIWNYISYTISCVQSERTGTWLCF